MLVQELLQLNEPPRMAADLGKDVIITFQTVYFYYYLWIYQSILSHIIDLKGAADKWPDLISEEYA